MQTILVVDDDEQVRDFIRTVLKQTGYFVEAVRNGNEAGQFLAHREPDLLITDMSMPHKAGNQLIQEVRANHPRVPIFAISGAITAQPGIFLKLAKSLGADYILAKPFSHDDLLRVVKRALGE